eukprot:s2902_g1.t1
MPMCLLCRAYYARVQHLVAENSFGAHLISTAALTALPQAVLCIRAGVHGMGGTCVVDFVLWCIGVAIPTATGLRDSIIALVAVNAMARVDTAIDAIINGRTFSSSRWWCRLRAPLRLQLLGKELIALRSRPHLLLPRLHRLSQLRTVAPQV